MRHNDVVLNKVKYIVIIIMIIILGILIIQTLMNFFHIIIIIIIIYLLARNIFIKKEDIMIFLAIPWFLGIKLPCALG